MSLQCLVCSTALPRYTCPRCNAAYCSLRCYKDHSTQCTQNFLRDSEAAELRILTASEEDRCRMQDILVRLHEQTLHEGESSQEDEEDLVPGLSLNRAFQLAEGTLAIDDLSYEEQASIQRAFINSADPIEAWSPWWLSDAAESLELSSTGGQLISELEKDNTNNMLKEIQSLPPPPAAPIPPLSSLTSKPPSPELALHLVDTLYSYCLVMRLYNGQYTADPIDAADAILSASEVLVPRAGNEAISRHSVTSALIELVAKVCEPSAGRAHVPRGFAVSVLADVARLLQLGRAVLITAFADLSSLLAVGVAEVQNVGNEEKRNLAKRLKQAQRKVLYFLSWVNEMPAEMFIAQGIETQACYERLKMTLQPHDADKIETIQVK